MKTRGMKPPPPRMRDLRFPPLDGAKGGPLRPGDGPHRAGEGPPAGQAPAGFRDAEFAGDLGRRLWDADDTAEIPTAPADRSTHPGSRRDGSPEERSRTEDRDAGCRRGGVRGLASLALASGTGEDVAALATASPRPRWRLDAMALRVLLAALALICLAVWGWMAFQRPERSDSSGIVEEGTSRRVPSGSASRGKAPSSGGWASPSAGASASARESSGHGDGKGTTAVVYVTGEVAKPGVYTVVAGSRVNDVVDRAGGLTDRADRGQTNLAAPVADGDHVHVAGVGEQTGNSGKQTGTPGSRGRGAAGAGSPGKRLSVNINTADAAELQRLPGVGPATAAAIVTWREKNGPFRSVDDLLDVSGIGKATLSKIRDSVRI